MNIRGKWIGMTIYAFTHPPTAHDNQLAKWAAMWCSQLSSLWKLYWWNDEGKNKHIQCNTTDFVDNRLEKGLIGFNSLKIIHAYDVEHQSPAQFFSVASTSSFLFCIVFIFCSYYYCCYSRFHINSSTFPQFLQLYLLCWALCIFDGVIMLALCWLTPCFLLISQLTDFECKRRKRMPSRSVIRSICFVNSTIFWNHKSLFWPRQSHSCILFYSGTFAVSFANLSEIHMNSLKYTCI